MNGDGQLKRRTPANKKPRAPQPQLDGELGAIWVAGWNEPAQKSIAFRWRQNQFALVNRGDEPGVADRSARACVQRKCHTGLEPGLADLKARAPLLPEHDDGIGGI